MADQTPETPPAEAVAKAPKTDEPLPNLPDQWPGAFGVYKYSKQAVKLNLVPLIILWVITFVLSGASDRIFGTAGSLVGSLLSIWITAAYTLVYLAGIRGEKLSIGDSLTKALPYWLKMLGLSIVVSLTLLVSILLLIIPFLFVWPRLTLAYYYLIDKNMGIMEAYKASWEGTKGHAGKIWGIAGVTFLMVLLAFTLIGIPFSIYFLLMYSAAYVVLYGFLSKSQPAAAKPAPAAAPVAPAAPVA